MAPTGYDTDEGQDEVLESPVSHASRSNSDRPRRPRSAFMFYSRAHRHSIQEENPGAAFNDLARMLAQRFKDLPDQELRHWQKKAAEDKVRYQEEMKNYVPPDHRTWSPNSEKRAKKNAKAPKLCLNAFFLFSVDERPRVRKDNPGASFGDVASEISRRWESLSAKERKIWDQKAAADKQRYNREMAEYSGTPMETDQTIHVTENQPTKPNSQQPNNTRLRNDGPYFFVKPDGVQAIRQFRYSGTDHSLLYKYVLSPLAQYLVDHWTPPTVAPNTITVAGLSLLLVSYTIQFLHSPLFDQAPPQWTFLYHGTVMLIYQTLDNMDGKQARKTKSSSPVGQLVDHGCDAVNCLFGSAGWILGMAASPAEQPLLCWIALVLPLTMFYMSTVEEYLTGHLRLPIFNGPNEGLLGGALLSFAAGVFGPQAWQEPLEFLGGRWRPIHILMGTFAPVYALELVRVVWQLSQKYGGARVGRALGPWCSLVLGSGWLFFSFESDKTVLLQSHPRTVLHIVSGLFVEMVTQLMLSHMTQQRFATWRWVLWPWYALIGLEIIITINGWSSGFAEWGPTCWVVYATALWTWLAVKSVLVLHELCHALGIWCFDITTPRRGGKEE